MVLLPSLRDRDKVDDVVEAEKWQLDLCLG
jgi:hypothetical protein